MMAWMDDMSGTGTVRCVSHVPASFASLARSPGSLLASSHTNLKICRPAQK